MRASLGLLGVLSTLSFVAASPVEPRDPESGCMALCGACPCPNPATSTKQLSSTSSSSASTTSQTSLSAPQTSGSAAEPSDFKSGEEPYRVIPPGTVDSQNIFGTWLYGYDGCSARNPAYKGNIDEAYLDTWTMSNTPGVKENINWNEAVSHLGCTSDHTSSDNDDSAGTGIPGRSGCQSTEASADPEFVCQCGYRDILERESFPALHPCAM